MKKNNNLKVAIIMGSQSDYKTMQLSSKILKVMGVKFETKIISAHRTPKRMYEFASSAKKNNFGVIIAGAGGSAHLPGMISAMTSLPVLGVPIESKKLKGLDSLLSIAQMPKGIPVGALAIGEDGAINAALLATAIIANTNPVVKTKLDNCIKDFSGKNFSDFKEILSQVLVDKIVPISQEIQKLLNDKNYLDKILLDGSEKADKIASEKVKKIHEIIGI